MQEINIQNVTNYMTIEAKYHALKKQFMHSLLNLLVFNDWNDQLLAETEVECGFAKGYHHLLFPDGLSEIVDYFENWQDQSMLNHLSKLETPAKIREKIALALRIRIKDCGHKLVHIKNVAYFTTPANIIFATKMGWRTCDAIWYYAGDKSIDHNYYTKRSLLLTVYITSIMYYIQDESENHLNTDVFIANSLANIINISSRCKNLFKLPELSDIPIIRLFS